MKILCTDLEGTLAPEIWQEIANEYQIKDLQLTTREIPDFEELMQRRLDVLSKNQISYNELKLFLETIQPYDQAREFLASLAEQYQIVIVSDTFYELGLPVVKNNLEKQDLIKLNHHFEKAESLNFFPFIRVDVIMF